MKKIFSVLMILVIISINISCNRVQDESISQTLDNAWDRFGLFSYQIGDTDPVITIFMDDTKSERELKVYLEENIKKSTLNDYTIEIFKRNLQQVRKEQDENYAGFQKENKN